MSLHIRYDIYSAYWVAFLTKSDLEQDKIMLNRALEMCKREDGNDFLLPLLEKVQQLNDVLLSAVSEPLEQGSAEDSSSEYEDVGNKN